MIEDRGVILNFIQTVRLEFVRKKTQYILFKWGTSISFVTGDGVVGAHQQADQEQQQHPTSDGGSSAPIPGCGTKS